MNIRLWETDGMRGYISDPLDGKVAWNREQEMAAKDLDGKNYSKDRQTQERGRNYCLYV